MLKYIMKFLLILLFVFINILNAKTLSLTSQELEQIDKSYFKKQILKRIDNYEKLKVKIQDYSLIRKLSHVNTFYNKIIPQHDKQKIGISDYWSSRKEFLISGRGDCEDYAISKYFSLLEIGIPKDNLFLAIVKVKGAPTDHMVLLYFKDKKSIPLVLDNLSFRVIPITKRKKLTPKVIFNENSSYILKNSIINKRVRIDWNGDNKWEKVLNKVYKENR